MTQKLDKEHLEAIQTLQDQFAQNASTLGRIAIELKMLSDQEKILTENQNELFTEFSRLRTAESELIEKMRARYGDGQINIADGTFTSN